MSVEQAECERLFMAAAPFVRAEHETHKRLIAARAEYKAARTAAAFARHEWVEFMLKHDHLGICVRHEHAERLAAAERPSDVAEGREEG